MKRIVGVLAVALLGAAAAAQEVDDRAPREIKRSAVTFHLVANEARSGYEEVKTPSGETLYIANKPMFTGGDVSAARLLGVEEGANVVVTLHQNAARRFRSLERRGAADKLAVRVDGEVLAAAKVQPLQADGTITVAGLETRQADRLMVSLQRDLSAEDRGLTLAPDQRTGQAGGTFIVKAFVTDLKNVRGYQLTIDITGGEQGNLVVDDVFIDEGDEQYLFGGTQTFNAVNRDTRLIVNALPAGAVDRAGRSYVGTFVLKASADAKGEFRVAFRGGDHTVFLTPAREHIDVGPIGETAITIR